MFYAWLIIGAPMFGFLMCLFIVENCTYNGFINDKNRFQNC